MLDNLKGLNCVKNRETMFQFIYKYHIFHICKGCSQINRWEWNI